VLRKFLICVTAFTAFAIIAAPSNAARGGTTDARGNSANAKLCQKGGFATYDFASAGKCTSHAAQGGELTVPVTDDPLEAACNAAGGSLSFGQTAFEGGFVKTYFSCINPTGMTAEQKAHFFTEAVSTVCAGYSEPGYQPGSLDSIYDRDVSFFFVVGVTYGSNIDDGT
jgi:hypothetical protein